MEDIIDVFEEEATEDMYRMIGMSETRRRQIPFGDQCAAGFLIYMGLAAGMIQFIVG